MSKRQALVYYPHTLDGRVWVTLEYEHEAKS